MIMNAKRKVDRRLLDQVVSIAVSAGREILDVYDNSDLTVNYKQDGSPLTLADLRSHEFIQVSLEKMTPDIPILSEESSPEIHRKRHDWSTFWLVDPLDGTKGFVRGNGEFTVNIALIQESRPVLGVVYTPVRDLLHFAAHGVGAFSAKAGQKARSIQTRKLPERQLIMVSSRSHKHAGLDRFMERIELLDYRVETYPMGSSLKLCLLSEGLADVYPRFGPTSEWDTAAAHCVLEVAGGQIQDVEGNSLEYNKPDILNPAFIASGSSEVDWTSLL
ncbi:MAG: 3'(2'),5'-bisphosphate nucleotidase CysQ [Gammaproteobacteria bacterium]|nr:3'(2'),5'-bisphosphate nucleotidase CysQ [Gammaproteobacteria bacterium]MCY4313958.1 3'(2'),5'-bisphosphate nucleotidase CysQ [Gammaproteobacteria bacterium]